MRVESLSGLSVVKVECGSQFSVALTAGGTVYTWGKGDYHRLGHGVDEHVRRPKKVATLQGKKVTLTSMNVLLSGVGRKTTRTAKNVVHVEIDLVFAVQVVCVSTGALHCVVCTDQGEILTWGDNDEGQLGDGTTTGIQKPRLVAALQDKNINRVACGSAHTVAWSTCKAPATPTAASSKLPQAVPLQYDLLKDVPITVLRNRLLLLHYFAEILCPVLPLLPLAKPDEVLHGPVASEGVLSTDQDKLRVVLLASAKEAAFRKVTF